MKTNWEEFYDSYMDIISMEQADENFHNGKKDFYILYCDGTEGMIDENMSEEEWEKVKTWDVMFGYEK